jgi:hypothetical protein
LPEYKFVLETDIIISLLKGDRCIFKLILDNLALYLQNEVAILITALTISYKNFIREMDQRATRPMHHGRFFPKTRPFDEFSAYRPENAKQAIGSVIDKGLS